MKPIRYSLRVLSQLLSYPDAELRQQLPLLLPVLEEEGALGLARRTELQALVTHLLSLDTLDAEARLVCTCLNMCTATLATVVRP